MPRHHTLQNVILCAIVTGFGSSAPLAAAAVSDAVAQQLETRARAFWTCFCHEDLTGMAALSDAVVLDDITKGFWVRRQLEKIHHQPERVADPKAPVPVLVFSHVIETSVMNMQARIFNIDAYQVTFTCPEMSGTMCISRDASQQVIAFTGQ